VVAEKAPIDALIGHVAERQHGHITREQLLALGLSPRAITARVLAGKLIRVHNGVYAVGHAPRNALARAHAAVLACGGAAALSHESALASWGLREWPRTHEVTVRSRRTRPGIRTHRSTTLQGDVWTHHGIRTTNPVRTLADIAPRRTDRQLTRLINDARRAQHLNPTALRRLLVRCPRARELVDPTQNPTRSGLEDDFVAWIARHNLPMPRLNVPFHGREVDALYEDQRLIIELDDWLYHGDRSTYNADHRRDADHRALGYETIRYTGELLTDAEAEGLRARLSRS
jgi:putative AbiEi antitoxin of type IV toxin-antitoxin system